ncbi:MAG: hypothetical protein U9N87_02985 [Planctomycetota bacterium]|nr:hypothetical protein [Planctomycetota bacterium]
MAVRRRAEADDISLFPFLSILASIIGVLTLLISTMALTQMDSEEFASLEQYEKVQRDLKEMLEEIERLKKQMDADAFRMVSELDQTQRDLIVARKRLEELLKRIEELQEIGAKPMEVVEVPEVKGVLLKQDLKAMQDELKGIKEQLAQLEKDLDERKRPPEESVVSVLPGGSGLGFEPVFVECAAKSVVLHARAEPEHIAIGGLEGNESFAKLLAHVAGSPKRTLVFLIRDNGLGTYRKARDLANWSEARNGKLPIIGQGKLDLSYFIKK